MLDLKELEKKIDEMIANDTPEEMMEWLVKKRMNKFANIISEGKWEPLGTNINIRFINSYFFVSDKSNKEDFIEFPKTTSIAA